MQIMKIKNNEITTKETKVFEGKLNEEKDMMLEINIAETPMFSFAKKNESHYVKDLINRPEVSSNAKSIMDDIYIGNPNSKVAYRFWQDSKGINRELIIASVKPMPDAFALDVFLGLVSLLIKENSPMFPDEKGSFDFKTNEVSFSYNQLCKEMKIIAGTATYKRIERALSRLFSVEYYSFGSGSIYEKSKQVYVSRTKAIKIINNYEVSERIKSLETGEVTYYKGKVRFDDLIISNLSLGFAKIIRSHQYFELKSGIGRGLYLYLEANKNSTRKYIKRSYDVLRNKIPVSFTYPSKLKEKLKKPLKEMVELGIIKDYFYGDEVLINGVKEGCLYVIFKGTRKQAIDHIIEKTASPSPSKQEELETDFNLQFPDDLKAELKEIGVNPTKITEIMQKYNKWKIAEYVLWIKDGIAKGKVKDAAAMFIYAITAEMVNVGKTHPQIVEFVAKIKSEVEVKKTISKATIDKEYRKYLEKEFNLFKEEEEFMYEATKAKMLEEMEKIQEEKLKGQKNLLKLATKESEKETILKNIKKWEKFSTQGEESEIFKEQLIKKIKIIRNLKNYEEFKVDFANENK